VIWRLTAATSRPSRARLDRIELRLGLADTPAYKGPEFGLLLAYWLSINGPPATRGMFRMSAEAARTLKQAFLDAYGHFADKRIKNIDSGSLFIIDDRGPKDVGADRALYPWFCQIFAEVIDQHTVRITMRGDVPQGALVARWFEAHGAEETNFGLQFNVRKGDQAKLAALANSFRSIVGPGQRYEVKSYKYVCPRVADALDRLQGVLAHAWQNKA
jgi:hypothetical protein